MPDYSQGKVYAIRSFQTTDVYIGATTRTLSKRLYEHKNDLKYFRQGKGTFVTSYDIVKYEDCYIELLESVSCKSKEELTAHEKRHIRSRPCVNSQYVTMHPNNGERIQAIVETLSSQEKQEFDKNYKKTYVCEVCKQTIRVSGKSSHETSYGHNNYIEDGKCYDTSNIADMFP
jgi:hypothetical protein